MKHNLNSIILILTFTISSHFAYCQPANDDCGGAISLTPNSTCNTTTGDVASATESMTGCYGTADDDVWYSFVATATSHTVTVAGAASFDAVFQVFSSSCGGTSVICVDDSGTGSTEKTSLTGLTINNTYWVRVYDYYSGIPATTTFTICIQTPPVNDECSGALTVTVNSGTSCSSTTSGTVENATASADGIGACAGTADDDVWFQFVATATSLTINITNVAGSTTDLYHTVYSGSCGVLSTEILCSDDDGSNISSLTIGATYFLRIYTYTPTTEQNTTFDVCILPTPPPPTNITCESMNPICSGSPTVFTAQSDGSSAAVGPNYDCLISQPNPSWYYLEIDNPGLLSVEISAGSDVDFALWGPYSNLTNAKAACNTYPLPVDCSFDASATEQADVSSTLTGEVYVLLVTNYAAKVQIINIDQSASAVATTNCAIVPLPIEMTYFEVILREKIVSLKWNTEKETNNDYFTVQRSEDGLIWETIGLKKGKINSSSETVYEYFDENPFLGISYYRLKQTDTNGDYIYTPIKSVKNNPELDFAIYPMPAKDEVKINTDNKKLDEIQIYDVLGNQISVPYTIINNEYILTISHLKKGVYSVIMTFDDKKINRRLIKT